MYFKSLRWIIFFFCWSKLAEVIQSTIWIELNCQQSDPPFAFNLIIISTTHTQLTGILRGDDLIGIHNSHNLLSGSRSLTDFSSHGPGTVSKENDILLNATVSDHGIRRHRRTRHMSHGSSSTWSEGLVTTSLHPITENVSSLDFSFRFLSKNSVLRECILLQYYKTSSPTEVRTWY